MKKMKKLFSKLVTLVLLVAVLLPHTTIPKVEAAETCNGEWEYHTNYYFFLQAEHPVAWTQWLAYDHDNDGVVGDGEFRTNYYTSFLYNFPSDGSTIEFLDEDFVRITDSDDVDDDFDPADERTSWTAGQFYNEFQKKEEGSEIGDYYTHEFKVGNHKGTDDDRIVSYLFHGDWASLGNTGTDVKVKWDLNDIDIQDADETLTIDQKISKLVDASILIDRKDAKLDDVEIGAAGISNGNVEFKMDWVRNAIKQYNRYSISDESVKYQETGVVQYIKNIKNPVINLVIGRDYELEDVFKSGVTKVVRNLVDDANDDPSFTITYNGEDYELNFPEDGESKYITYTQTESTNEINISEQKSIVIEASNGKDISWFLAPTLYQMSYRVCKTGTNDGTVKVTYDGNESSVNTTAKADKVPAASDPIAVGGSYTVSSQEPTLEGYKFQVWNTDPKCGEGGLKLDPEALINKITNNTTLYACWGELGAKGPKDPLGVSTYAALFTGIIALAGGAYYLVKKKNIFKKI